MPAGIFQEKYYKISIYNKKKEYNIILYGSKDPVLY